MKAMLLELQKFSVPEVDWPRILLDLKRLGIPYDHIETACNEYHGWAYKVVNEGMKPKHRPGQILLAMHSHYCQ